MRRVMMIVLCAAFSGCTHLQWSEYSDWSCLCRDGRACACLGEITQDTGDVE